MARTLGIDLGNAKVKYVALTMQGDHPIARWAVFPLPYSPELLPDRRVDFEAGMLTTAASFMAEHGWSAGDFDQVVIATSHFYSYPTFREALGHTAQMASSLWGERARLIGAEGRLYAPAEIAAWAGREVLRFAATKFWGSAYLASKLIAHGLSVDVGTTSTDAIAVVDGAIEPGSAADPDQYNLERLETQRLMWYGATATPLDYAARHASVGDRSYYLYPRLATTEVLTRILDLVPPELARRHAYAGRYPSRDQALAELAQAFGLDRELLTDEDLQELAGKLHRQLIARVAEGLAKVIARARLGMPKSLQAVVCGLGKDALARPSLLACGVPESQILDLEDVLGDQLSSVSTAYGVALRALEDVLGSSLALTRSPSASPA